MEQKEFVRRLQASFDVVYGPGVSTIELLGPAPDEGAIMLDVRLQPTFGGVAGIFEEEIEGLGPIEESAGKIAFLAAQLSQSGFASSAAFANAITAVTPVDFMPDTLDLHELAVGKVLSVQKRPVAVEAMIWDGSAAGAVEVIAWITGAGGTAWVEHPDAGDIIAIETLEGVFNTPAGSAVIRGVEGEFYSCRRDIFEKTYREVPHA